MRTAWRAAVLVLLLLIMAPTASISDECIRCRMSDELKQLVLSQITEHGLTVDPEADSFLNELVDHAARELERDHFDDTKIKEAKEDARKLGVEIAVQAGTSQQSSKSSALWLASSGHIVTIAHIWAALHKLCPLYPFCKKPVPKRTN